MFKKGENFYFSLLKLDVATIKNNLEDEVARATREIKRVQEIKEEKIKSLVETFV